jgi:hypothetical protein
MSFFKKLVNTFTSNESRYNAERSRYIAKTLNSVAEIDLSTFPKGGIPRPVSIAQLSPIHILSNNICIDLRKTIQLFYLYAMGHKNKDVRDWYDIHLSRIYDTIKSKDESFIISKDKFLDIAVQTATYIDKIVEVGEINFYDASVVISHDSNFEEHGKFDSLFHAFYLFQGFAILIGLPAFENMITITEGVLNSYNLKEFKKFSDLSKTKLVKKIIDKNIELEILSTEEIENLTDRINMDVNQSEFSVKFYIEWLILVFIYEGKSFEEAISIIRILVAKLNDSNKDWEMIIKIYLLHSNFLSTHELERGKILIEFMNNLTALAYHRA